MAADPDSVSVQLFSGIQTAVESFGNLAYPEDLYVFRKIMIHIITDFFAAHPAVKMAVRHLPQSMDPCVCPACALDQHRASSHTEKYLLDLSLYGIVCSLLPLPASISGSVVLYIKSIVHISCPSPLDFYVLF